MMGFKSWPNKMKTWHKERVKSYLTIKKVSFSELYFFHGLCSLKRFKGYEIWSYELSQLLTPRKLNSESV